ncbi:MAG: hypothetical protein JWP91_2527 [Fibrobacteres bacterium]|nr:hypothetical protein [Fibrobacterota bacterium]
MGEWFATLASPRARPLYALAMTLVLGIGLLRFLPGLGSTGPAHREKGGEAFEVLLRIGSHDLEPGETGLAADSDTLSFSYRSPGPRHVQVWYQEDEADLHPFPGREGPSLAWPAATRWTQPPQKILLKGNWKKQSVWVVASEAELSPAEAKAAIQGAKGAVPHATVVQFRMKHPE